MTIYSVRTGSVKVLREVRLQHVHFIATKKIRRPVLKILRFLINFELRGVGTTPRKEERGVTFLYQVWSFCFRLRPG